MENVLDILNLLEQQDEDLIAKRKQRELEISSLQSDLIEVSNSVYDIKLKILDNLRENQMFYGERISKMLNEIIGLVLACENPKILKDASYTISRLSKLKSEKNNDY